MSISAAIIMKNEERVIERCLACVSKLADEIILVDTGSTDKSKELAAKFPKVKLFDSELFNKDTHYSDFEFGKAKNEAIRRCTGDWVIWWDADDFIDDSNVAKIQEIAENEKRPCLYTFKVISGSLVFEHCRLFMNGRGILFDENHACHEFLDSRNHPVALRYDVEIQHLPENKSIASHKRNLAIMEKDYYVRKHEDQRTLFYLANAYQGSGQLLRAVEFYDKYLVVSQWREERFFARFYKAQCLFRWGRVDEGRDEALHALGEDSRFAEAMCFLGDVEMSKGNWERAILWYKMALQTPFPSDARLFVMKPLYSEYPAQMIGECMAHLGLDEEPKKSSIKEEVFELPMGRDLAMLAAAALSNIVTAKRAKIMVSPKDEWQRVMISGFETLSLSRDVGKKLSLPADLKGVHAQEWLARSAGHAGINQEPVRITKCNERKRLHIIVTPDVNLPPNAVEKIRLFSGSVVILNPDCKFKEAKAVFLDAAAYIGSAGWLQHLAKWTSVPAFVFFDGRNPKEFGWNDHENRAEGDFSGMDKFLEQSLS